MKKQIKKLTSIMFAISLILCIIGCKKEPEFNILDYVYTVSFESNGGEEIDSQTVVIGETVEKPVDPVHTAKPETEKFEGWYTDKGLKEEYDFSAKVKNSFTLYAKWRHEHSLGETTIEPTCTQEGKKTVYCTVCEYEKEETIPAKGHTLGIWTVTKDPTDTEVGQMKRECEGCGETETKDLQPVPEGFVLVKAGTFQMGSNEGKSYNKPVHEVTITKPFYMGKYEVTQAEYEVYCSYGSSSPSSSYGDGDNYPAYYVSWYDAIVYCNERSIAEGLTPCYRINDSTEPDEWGTVPTSSDSVWNAVECDWNADGYRLPTEAEWEWLARGGENYEYAGSDNEDDVAWNDSNTYNTGTREVKTKAPNGYGLYDMSGNVLEWCWDWYGSGWIFDSTAADGAPSGNSRVLRGGSWWYYDEGNCRVAYRDHGDPDYGSSGHGFRVVRQAN